MPQGLDTEANVLQPKVVEALLGTRFSGRDFRRSPLVAGSRNTLAIDADGNVLAFGWNARGSLGHGHRGNERKPRRVAGLKGVRVVQVALGGWHALALDDQGQVYGFGGEYWGSRGDVAQWVLAGGVWLVDQRQAYGFGGDRGPGCGVELALHGTAGGLAGWASG